MFLIPLSLHDISTLRHPSERVPLAEKDSYEVGLQLIEEGAFERVQPGYEPDLLRVFFKPLTEPKLDVTITEAKPGGPLRFECSHCLEAGRKAQSCPHQWATYVLLWRSLVEPMHQGPLAELSKWAQARKQNQEEEKVEPTNALDTIFLDSMSLYLEEPPLGDGRRLSEFVTQDFSEYRLIEVVKGQELLSPRLWNLPEIFRRKLTAYSEHYFHEVNRQNRMAGLLRYNFSNGTQICAKEILRHPYQRKVPLDLLPQAKAPASVFAQWPLIQQHEGIFVSQAVKELEEIMQALLAQVIATHRQGKLELFLQAKGAPQKALKLQSVEFDPSLEVDWRVEFSEKKELEAEFKLVSFRKQALHFYESFALTDQDAVLVVHPWLKEFSLLQENLKNISPDLTLSGQEKTTIHVVGEMPAKALLRYLRTRNLPVRINGDSRVIPSTRSEMEVRMNSAGTFYVQHTARVPGQKNLERRGWTSKTQLYFQALSQGLGFLLNKEPRDLVAKSRLKRDWDLKLLKHLGILQYVLLETLSLHFEGHLTDGRIVGPEEVFEALSENIQALLVAGAGNALVRDVHLQELCSRAVLTGFDDFVRLTLKSLTANEAFYFEYGEVIMEGVVEREFRLLFEILKQMALRSKGETFKKSRSPLLAKIASSEDSGAAQAEFHFSNGDSKDKLSLHESLESLQPLIPQGLRIFIDEMPLQELGEDEFHIDFILQTARDEKLINWFELNPKFFLRGEEVDPDRFLSLGGGGVVEYAGRLYLVPRQQIPSLRRLEKFWQKLQKSKIEGSKKKNGDKIYHLPRNQTLELLALRASGVGIRGDAEWKDLCDFYDHLGAGARTLKLPVSVKASLKPYQETGVLWLQDLYRLKLGALLADDMGLGKTLQTLGFLEDLRVKGELGSVLVVVPSSLIFNWQSEIEKFTPELPMMVFSNKDRDRVGRRLETKDPVVVIATYGLLMEHGDFLTQYRWQILIFDEAQNLKNITTKRTSAARSLTAQFKICLTGTPMENHYGEFYSLVDILVPGSLGRIEDFRRQFVNTEMITREEMDDLKLKIKPLLLRRTKKEILDQLPEKQETKISIAFEERQKEIYRDIALSYNQRVQETMAIQGEASVQLQMLTALLRLRQACSDPAALPNVHYDKVPPKLETLLDSLTEIVESGESALVFTQFLRTLEHTADILRQAQIPVFVLHGGIPSAQRQKILAEFNKVPGGAVLVMTLKTGGVGLNLTKASYVFHLEPWWNPSVENQATDRAHRLGQSKAVQVFRYIMHESLEEKIELLKNRKDRRFQALLAAPENEAELGGAGGSGLSKQDFDLLLGLK